MSKPKSTVEKKKFGTTLPVDIIKKVNEYAERENMYVEELFASALNLWFDAMDGKGSAFKPTNAEHHRRLEAILNSKDAAVLEAVGGVMDVCERLIAR